MADFNTSIVHDAYLERYRKSGVAIAVPEKVAKDYAQSISDEVSSLLNAGIRTHVLCSDIELIRKIETVNNDLLTTSLVEENELQTEEIMRQNGQIVYVEDRPICNMEGKHISTVPVYRDHHLRIAEIMPEVRIKVLIALAYNAVLASDNNDHENKVKVHIVDAGDPHAIQKELLTLEGSGTIIGGDFSSNIMRADEEDIDTIMLLLQPLPGEKSGIKPRSEEEIRRNISGFYITRVDDIAVGCIEIKKLDHYADTLELGALRVHPHFSGVELLGGDENSKLSPRKISLQLIAKGESIAREKGKSLLLVTDSPALKKILIAHGYVRGGRMYPKRIKKSPGKKLYVKQFKNR